MLSVWIEMNNNWLPMELTITLPCPTKLCLCVHACMCMSVCRTLSTVAIKARQLSGQATNQNMTSAKLKYSFSQRAYVESLKSSKTSSIRFIFLWQAAKLDDIVDFYFPSKSPTVCINKQAWIASINGRVGQQCETGPLAEGCIGSCCWPPPLPLDLAWSALAGALLNIGTLIEVMSAATAAAPAASSRS